MPFLPEDLKRQDSRLVSHQKRIETLDPQLNHYSMKTNQWTATLTIVIDQWILQYFPHYEFSSLSYCQVRNQSIDIIDDSISMHIIMIMGNWYLWWILEYVYTIQWKPLVLQNKSWNILSIQCGKSNLSEYYFLKKLYNNQIAT